MNSDSESTSRAPAPIVGVTPADLDRAAAVIIAGGLVAIPTETVYGLAADATNGLAVAKIYTAKGRSSFNPLICHVSGLAMAEEHAHFTPLARRLAEEFWPGPLTLVLPRKSTSTIADLVTAGLPSIALRSPKHVAALGLIERVGRPLAAPSANPSETLSPTTAQHVAHNLASKIDLIVDGGACVAGIESTIVAPGEDSAVMLRPGALARAEIEQFTGVLKAPDEAEGVLAPGMMRRHYAPRARLRLDALDVRPGEAYLGFGAPPNGLSPSLNLSIRGDLEEAAANLFAMLRALDETHDSIAVAPIPVAGLGEGINDRLKRAGALASQDSV
jgi:L-threonylcarbamoyladenylate synthase